MPMRNPLAGLVRRNPEAPTLRQRAASLKAAAARVIRKPVAASPSLASGHSPDADLVSLEHKMMDARVQEEASYARQARIAEAGEAIGPAPAPERFEEWKAWFAKSEAWRDTSGMAEEEEAGRRWCGVVDDFAKQIAASSAATVVGLRVKARLIRYYEEIGVDPVAGLTTGFARDVLSLCKAAGSRAGEEIAIPLPAPSPIGLDTELLALGQRFEEAHAAWMAVVPAGREADECIEAFRLKAIAAGMDGRSALMAAWLQEKPKENHDREAAAFSAVGALTEAIITLPAHTVAGLAVKARAAAVAIWPTGLFEKDRALGEDENWDKSVVRDLIDACVRLAKAPQPEGAEEAALIDAIEQGWAEWTTASAALRSYVGPDADVRVEEINRTRYALIAAAEALPATSRAARHAKALAYAWWDAVEYEAPGLSREDCDRGGRLVLDIGAALNASQVA